jgi:proteasome accessory factor B
VRVRFDAFAARLVGERLWHSSQRIRDLGEGAIELSLELASLEEIERWILSWGKHARVLAPKELSSRIRDEASAIASLYSN